MSAGDRSLCSEESARLMSTVAERADCGCTAAAEGKRFFAFEIKHIASGVGHSHRSGNQERAVIFHKHFDIRHLRTFSKQRQGKVFERIRNSGIDRLIAQLRLREKSGENRADQSVAANNTGPHQGDLCGVRFV